MADKAEQHPSDGALLQESHRCIWQLGVLVAELVSERDRARRELATTQKSVDTLRNTRCKTEDDRDKAQSRVDGLEYKLRVFERMAQDRKTERDEARQARDINADHKDDYKKRWFGVQRQRDKLIGVHDTTKRVYRQLVGDYHVMRQERNEARAVACRLLGERDAAQEELRKEKDIDIVKAYWNLPHEARVEER